MDQFQFRIKSILNNPNQYVIDFPRCLVFFNNQMINSISEFETMIEHFPIITRQEYRSMCTQTILAEYVKFLQDKTQGHVGEQNPAVSMCVYCTNEGVQVFKPLREFTTDETLCRYVIFINYTRCKKTIECSRFMMT